MKKRVRAVIVQGKSVLLIRRIKADKEYWVFPGGGVEELDVSPKAALVRECKEELGVDVNVGELLTEEILHSPAGDQSESFFICKILSGVVGTGDGPEFNRDSKLSGTYRPEWVPLVAFPAMNVMPIEARDKVISANL